MKITRFLPISIGILFFIAFVPFILSLIFIPSQYSYTNDIDINAPVEKVWGVINDRSKFTEWHPYSEKVVLKDDKHWSESYKDVEDKTNFSVINDSRPNSMEVTFMVGNGDVFHGAWTGVATPTATGTHLTTTDREVIDNYLARIPAYLFVDRNRYAKNWNEALKVQAEKAN